MGLRDLRGQRATCPFREALWGQFVGHDEPEQELPFSGGGEKEKSEEMKKVIRMRDMSDGQAGVIKEVSAKGVLGTRIREMGLVPGAPIEVQGRAPLKDPVAIKVRDFVLTLRNNEADHILVEVDEGDPETKQGVLWA